MEKFYGFGSNYNGILGINEKKWEVKSFTEISLLSSYKIVAVSAGSLHTLFQTSEGKILACGSNSYGELLLENGPTNDIFYSPVETSIKEGASLCIAGSNYSIIFKGFVPPNCPNRVIKKDEFNSYEKELKEAQQEILTLKEKIRQLEDEKNSFENKVKDLESKLESETKKNQDQQKNEFIILDADSIDSLRKIEIIGQGSQLDVIKVAKDEFFALKEFRLITSKNEAFVKMKNFVREMEAIRNLNHRNIIKSYGVFFGDETRKPSILLEFCPYNLKNYIKKLNNCEKVASIYEISSAMEQVHLMNIIHRDLKPENILIDSEKHIKISDFGSSRLNEIDDEYESKTSGVGTLKFMAPEILNECTNYCEKVDVYSFGVVVYFILTNGGYPDIKFLDIALGKKAIIPDNINSLSKDLVNRCWSFNPNDRPSFSEILELIRNNNFNLIDGVDNEIQNIKHFLKL